ncbi:hypothetical protein ABH926_001085 [Catenulispora sp. GP43]|uniref:hypothetical protein n=1 Tax=Catenulispora sp. GP43 TaxID=3156263 RepID=UPI003517E0C6
MRRKISRIAVAATAAACVVTGGAAMASASTNTGPLQLAGVYNGPDSPTNKAECTVAGVAFQVSSGGRYWECDASTEYPGAWELWEEQ